MENKENKDVKSYMMLVLLIQGIVLFTLFFFHLELNDDITELKEYIIISKSINTYYHNMGCVDMLLVLNMSLNSSTKELYEECKI